MNFSEDYNLNKSESEDGTLTLAYTGLICKDQGLEIVTARFRGFKSCASSSCGKSSRQGTVR